MQQERAVLNELITRREARQNLLAFTEYTTPRYIPGPIHEEICRQCERIVRGDIDRLMILCPPQHGKSEIVSRRLPAYLLGLDPTLDTISVSAEQELAQGFGRDVRNCIDSPEYKNLFPEVELSHDSTAKGRWHTNKGGSYYAVGIGGSLFGRGGAAIIDDPFKSWEEAQSELKRERVWEWYTGTLYNRIRPGQPIILIQHRMHEDDLAGRLIEASKHGGDQWEIINLPADIDNPPWPQRYDSEALARIKANSQPRQWESLYMQNPTPDEGTFFQREWFWRYEPNEVPAVRKYLSSDFAVTESDDADSTELGVHGLTQGGDKLKVYACLDGWSGKTAPDVWIDEYVNLCLRHKPLTEFNEAGVIRRSIEGFLTRRRQERRCYGRTEWIPPIADKQARARALQGMASMGMVGLPNNEYGERVLTDLLKFPASADDHTVDMLTIFAQAIDQAHPAIVLPKEPEKPRDRWDAAFDDDDTSDWRT